MRSQNEILEKITQTTKILKSKRSPIYLQYKVLIHKLTWTNARRYINPKDYTEEYKLKWKDTSCLEKMYILAEIEDQIDIAAMCVQEQDKLKTLACVLVIFIQIWLLGPRKDHALDLFWKEFYRPVSPHLYYENVFNCICEEFGFPWDNFKARYSPIII